MRPTDQIDDPTWDDVTDRDAIIRRLSHIVRSQMESCAGNNFLIDQALEDALVAIGDRTSVKVR